MPTVATRRPPPRVPAIPAALTARAGGPVWGPRVLRPSPYLEDAGRLPPARRLRPANAAEVPAHSRIVLRHGSVALR